jgi:hypothetical protein
MTWLRTSLANRFADSAPFSRTSQARTAPRDAFFPMRRAGRFSHPPHGLFIAS